MSKPIGVLCAVVALGLLVVFGANLVQIAMAGSETTSGLARNPNLNWMPLFGAVVSSVLAFYFLRKSARAKLTGP
jgi:TRAP-type C4-dicarboxylate transport system permease small subunit